MGKNFCTTIGGGAVVIGEYKFQEVDMRMGDDIPNVNLSNIFKVYLNFQKEK